MAAFLLLSGAVVAVVFRRFLLGESVYLYKDIGSDSINFFYPQITHLLDYWAKEGIPGWSFSQGLGQNIYPFSWNDPFYLILIPFGRAHWAYGIAFMEAVKIVSAGALFRLYLKEMRLSDLASTAGALLFAFSGFIVLGSGWETFSTEAVYCAFLLYAFERLLMGRSWRLLPIPFALIAAFQPFDLYPFALFLLAYGAVRYVDERRAGPRALIVFFARIAALGLLGMLLAGVFVFSEVLQLLQSPRVAGDASFLRALASTPVFARAGLAQAATAVLRLFSSDLLGTGSGYRGWSNYLEAPLFYCGLSTLLLAPQSFAFMDSRRRRLYGTLVVLAFLPVFFPYFRYAFWAFSGDYFRILSLFVAVVLIFLAARALDRLETRPAPPRAWTAVPLAGALLLLAAAPFAGAPVNPGLEALCAFFLAAYAAAILLMRSKANGRAARISYLALLCFEAALFSSVTVGTRPAVSARDLRDRIGYNDFTVEAVAYLKSDDHSFYRIVKNYRSGLAMHGSLNDAKAQGYYGVASYDRFNQKSAVEFLGETGVIDHSRETDTRWLTGLGARPGLESLLAVKYLLFKGSGGPDSRRWERLVSFGDVSVFRNRRFLPLAFGYDRFMTRAALRRLDPPGKDAALLESAVVDDGRELEFAGLARAAPTSGSAEDGRFERAVDERRRETFDFSTRTEDSIAGRFRAAGPRLLFFSIPYDEGWTARVDGARAALRRVDIGFTGLMLGPGEHRVELEFTPPLRRFGAAVSLLSLALYAALLARKRSDQLR
jgi:hypothetical protein